MKNLFILILSFICGEFTLYAQNTDVKLSVQSVDGMKIHIEKTSTLISNNIDENLVGTSVWIRPPYPNPFKNIIWIQAMWLRNIEIKNVHLKIYSLLGVEIADLSYLLNPTSSGGGNAQLQLVPWEPSGITSGLYFAVIQGGGNTQGMPIMFAGN